MQVGQNHNHCLNLLLISDIMSLRIFLIYANRSLPTFEDPLQWDVDDGHVDE